MIPSEIFNSIKDKLVLDVTASTGNVHIYCDGEKYTSNQVLKFGNALIPYVAKELPGRDLSGLAKDPTKYASEIFALAKEQMESNLSSGEGFFTDPEIVKLATQFQPYMDYQDTSKTLIYDLERKVVDAQSYDSWKSTVKDHLINLRKDKIDVKGLRMAAIYFDPYSSTEVKQVVVGSMDMPRINLYQRPQYLDVKLDYDTSTKYVEMFEKYMEHLVPDEEDRVYCYYWMYHCITSKMQCYLFLKGKQGTGKTDFAMILKGLVGENNFTATKNNFLSTEFNSFLDKKQVAYADEVICKREEHREAFKKLTNETVQIEGKGQNQRTVRSFCSFLISANQYTNIHIHPDDRRFSIIKCTSAKPDDSLGKTWYSEFRDYWRNEEFLKAVRDFILKHNDGKYDTYNRLHNHEYEIAVVESANKTLRKIYDHFGLRESESEETEVYYSDIRKKLESSERRFFSTIETVRENLESFTWYGEKIFKVEYDQTMEDYLIRKVK